MLGQPGEGQRTPVRPSAGFTLLEVLVAFVIVSLASIALFRGGRDGLRGVSQAGRIEAAVALAQSRLSYFDALPDPASPDSLGYDREGDDSGLHWTLHATPLGSVPRRGSAGRVPGNTILYRVAVTVAWTDGERSTSVSLESQRLTPATPLPP